MRGLGILIGYILGNEKARNWIVQKICQASCIIEQEMKKTQLVEVLGKEKKNDEVQRVD